MFCSGKGNNKINRLHERFTRIVNDYESTYEELLSHNNCFSTHDQNVHRLATEIYKVKSTYEKLLFHNNCFSTHDQNVR